MKKIICVMILLTTSIYSLLCKDWGTGLETGGDRRIYVIVEDLGEIAKKIGLNEQIIKSKIELRLRQNGLIPVDEKVGLDLHYYLYINIIVVKNAFSCDVEFTRTVIYMVNEKTYVTFATMWIKSWTGTHGNNGLHIVDRALDLIDIFINEFLSVNAP